MSFQASRRTFLATAGLAAAQLAASPLHAAAAAEPRRRFSVSLLCASQEVFDYIAWRLWDPLVLAAGIPDVRAEAPEVCDLLIVGERLPERGENAYRNYRASAFDDFQTALTGARGVIAVQPALLGEPLPDEVARRFKVVFRDWNAETPRQSSATDHWLCGLSRRLGRRADHVHITYDWHLEVDAPAEMVVTRLSSGTPDVVQHDRACFLGTNLFADLAWYSRHPDYRGHEAAVSALLAGLVRAALGEQPVVPPSVEEYDQARMAFYGYAFARKFVREVQSLKRTGPAADERIAVADGLVAQAARHLLAGDPEGSRRCLREAGGQLVAARQTLTPVKPYFVRGWHGGLLDDRVEGGEIVGYAEWGWPSWAMRWAEHRLHAAQQQSTPTVNQVCGNTWDLIADHGITDLARWRNASAAGLVETVKGMYSDAYLEVLGTESNLRQFEFGIRALARMGGKSQIFAIAYDDFAFHPQLPQILRGFGFQGAVLRCGGPGQITGVDKETLLWKGLDGSLIPAIPKYKSVPGAKLGKSCPGGSAGGINAMARQLVAAEKAGFRTVLAGGIQDHTMTMHGEYEWEAFNAMAHVHAVPTTFADYLAAVPPGPEPRFYGADDLLGRPFAWSGYGSLNQMAREDRLAERLLVTAEKFSALASFAGRPYPAKAFEKAWKNLLSSQDHFTYGCGGPDNPEGYHVGGLQEPFIPDYRGPRTPITTEATSQQWKANVLQTARDALDGALTELVGGEANAGSEATEQVLVYNACNWDRQGEVQCWISAPDEGRLLVDDGERQLPAVVLARSQEGDAHRALVSFQATAPSLGFRVYAIRQRAPGNAQAVGRAASATTLENRFLRVAIDPETGGITSIVEKSGGAELLRDGRQARFLCTEPVVDSSAAKAQVTLERSDSVAQGWLVSGRLADCSYRLRLSLGHESPVLEIDLEIDYGRGAIFGYKAQPGTLLRHVLPFKACSRRWVNLPFGVYETAVESPIALDFLDLDYGGRGVALVNDGVPGLHTPGDDIAVLVSDGVPPLRGVHRYRYGIYPHSGDWREARVPWRAWEFQQPLGAKPLGDRRVSLPCSRSYLQTTGNVVLSGLHFHENKPRTRFYDTTGSSSSVAATWHIPWPDPVITDLDGRHPRAVQGDARTVRFDLPAWGIVTLSGGTMQKGGRS